MTKCDRIKICGYWENSEEVPTSLPNSWFATTWQSGHVGSQNKRIKYRRIYMKIELSSQERREMRLFLTSNMAAVTSRANFRIQGRRRQRKHRWKSEFALILSSSHRSNSLTLSNVGELSSWIPKSSNFRKRTCGLKINCNNSASIICGAYNGSKNVSRQKSTIKKLKYQLV